MMQINSLINEFISNNINGFISNNIKNISMDFDEELMFDNENNKKMMMNHPSANIPVKYSDNDSWKDILLIEKIQQFMDKYNVKLYFGYNTYSTIMKNNCSNIENKAFIVYTNTNLYISFNYRCCQSGPYLSAQIYTYNINREDTNLFSLSNMAQNNYPQKEWYIRYREKIVDISNILEDKELDYIIRSNLIMSIHPYVYADYLFLCNPSDTIKILNSSKAKVSNIERKYDNKCKELENMNHTINSLKDSKDELIKDYEIIKHNHRVILEENESLNDNIIELIEDISKLNNDSTILNEKYTKLLFDFEVKVNDTNKILREKEAEIVIYCNDLSITDEENARLNKLNKDIEVKYTKSEEYNNTFIIYLVTVIIILSGLLICK
jgi:hypothetical protein